MAESCTWGFYNPLPAVVVSHIPFVSTARRLKRALLYSSNSASITPSVNSISSSKESESTPSSASSTPLIRPRTSSELSMTKLQLASTVSTAEPRRSRADGIDWNSVMLGHQMLISASQRASVDDDLMARVMYVDALKYLHGGLPSDISQSERSTVYALTPSLGSELCPYNEMQRHSTDNVPGSKIVRSGIASIVSFLIALFMLALPMFAALADKALEYERRHHITDKFLNVTGQIVRTAGTKGITIGGQIASSQMSSYTLLSLLGLVHSVLDGVSDGVSRHLQPRITEEEQESTRCLSTCN